MPTITQVSNANSLWSGTTPGSADATITKYRLYCACTDQPSAYRLVDQKANPGAVPLAWGPYSYGALHLVLPTRPFFLKVVGVRDTQELDLTSEPVLPVTPSAALGYTLGQLLAQGINPSMIVAKDPATGLFFPVAAANDGAGNFQLSTTASISMSSGVLTATKTQDLSLAALSLQSAFGVIHKPSFVSVSLTNAGGGAKVPLVNAQTMSITFVSKTGAKFSTLIETIPLPAGTTDVYFTFDPSPEHGVNDELLVEITNAGGVETAFAQVTIQAGT